MNWIRTWTTNGFAFGYASSNGVTPISDNPRGYIPSMSGWCLQPLHQTPRVCSLTPRETGPCALDIPPGRSQPAKCLKVAPPPPPPPVVIAGRCPPCRPLDTLIDLPATQGVRAYALGYSPAHAGQDTVHHPSFTINTKT